MLIGCYPTWAFSLLYLLHLFFLFSSWPCKTFSWPCKTLFFVLHFCFFNCHLLYIETLWYRFLTISFPIFIQLIFSFLIYPSWAVWIRLRNIFLQNHPIKDKSTTSERSCKRSKEPYLPCEVHIFLHVNSWRKNHVWAKSCQEWRVLESHVKMPCLSFSVKIKIPYLSYTLDVKAIDFDCCWRMCVQKHAVADISFVVLYVFVS